MEYYSMLFNNSSTANTVRGHNGNFTPNHHACDSWDLPTSSTSSTTRPGWTYLPPPPPPAAAAECSPFQAAMLHDLEKTAGGGHSCSSTITSSPLCCNPDHPHLTCLKLGKRQYFGDVTPPPMMEAFSAKRGKAAGEHAVPTCQVVGCGSVLVNAKDYHRRHKVCEMHAKAPKVVLLGIDQRFCQQCSRFHALGEFDEAKRSCRRRLAGHNERRRKSSQEQNSLARKQYQGRHLMSHLLNNSECALSLLSPTNNSPWSASPLPLPSPSPDLPARCSAALRELIAENRASVFACRQLMYSNANQMGDYKLASGWAASAAPENRDHVTLNLMQGPESTFGLISGHDHRTSEDGGNGDCSELWKLPLGY